MRQTRPSEQQTAEALAKMVKKPSTADIKAYKGWVIFTALISLISSFISLAFR